ncbi:MAG TPA: LysM peptidoglycan-binding domain-containing protein, partial [Acidobacteriota bacterium]|nr:LysM peptidoglycan-binding domain-containing protein [Acidobacteriota bacterium]
MRIDGSSGLPQGAGPTTYITQQGDTLQSVADQFQVSTQDLAKANFLSPESSLPVGRELVIPEQTGPAGAPSLGGPDTFEAKQFTTAEALASKLFAPDTLEGKQFSDDLFAIQYPNAPFEGMSPDQVLNAVKLTPQEILGAMKLSPQDILAALKLSPAELAALWSDSQGAENQATLTAATLTSATLTSATLT